MFSMMNDLYLCRVQDEKENIEEKSNCKNLDAKIRFSRSKMIPHHIYKYFWSVGAPTKISVVPPRALRLSVVLKHCIA